MKKSELSMLSRERRRSIGAIIGLAIGLTSMWALGLGGLIYAFIFGAGGTVIGAMIGERSANSRTGNRKTSHE